MLFGKLSPRILGYSTEAVFKEKREIWDSMLDLTITSPYLIVASEVQLSNPTTKGKGWGGRRPFLLVGPICISLLIIMFFMSIGKGEDAEG